MIPQWDWIGARRTWCTHPRRDYQQLRIYQIHQNSKKREELFQIVTENAADMIALVDVKGHRLYNSPLIREF